MARSHWSGASWTSRGRGYCHADQQVAFAHYLCHCGGTGPDGQPHSSWMRVSAGYRKQGDGWKVIHEHFSAPFDMDGKALFDLQP